MGTPEGVPILCCLMLYIFGEYWGKYGFTNEIIARTCESELNKSGCYGILD